MPSRGVQLSGLSLGALGAMSMGLVWHATACSDWFCGGVCQGYEFDPCENVDMSSCSATQGCVLQSGCRCVQADCAGQPATGCRNLSLTECAGTTTCSLQMVCA